MRTTYLIGMVLLWMLCACSENETGQITDPEDYNTFLNTSEQASYQLALEQKEYWSERLRPDSTGVGDLGPLAAAYTSLFETTAEIDHLKHAEIVYRKAISIAADNIKDGYIRGLAHNLISQHRFKEAKDLLESSYNEVSNKHQTALMLFDVYMELGNYTKADEFLGIIKNTSDYHYLIRLSKWMDHQGDLDSAIKYMEKASEIARSRDNKDLKIWTYSNLGDYYGHAGRIQDSYQMYLRTLELQPDNTYVKKGIAWIAYSAEGNTNEASRILDSVQKDHPAPEYLLFRAELAEYRDDLISAESYRDQFVEKVSNEAYGTMYTAYLIKEYVESRPEIALELALKETKARPTPESYHLLAYTQLRNGNDRDALSTIADHVDGYTSEPMALYHAALVYKQFDMKKKVEALKTELQEATFELGPVLSENVKNL